MHWKKVVKDIARPLILLLGVFWSWIAFQRALPGIFTLSGRDLPESLIAIFFGFLAVLPAAIIALWRPMISAVLLTAGFLLIELLALAEYGFHDASEVAVKLLPNLLLALGYSYLAYSRPRPPRVEG